jgi:hypothetical protein
VKLTDYLGVLGVDRMQSKVIHLTPGETAPVPTAQEVGWAPEPVTGRYGEVSPAPAGNRAPITRSTSPYPNRYNTNTNFNEIWCENVEWIKMLQDRIR